MGWGWHLGTLKDIQSLQRDTEMGRDGATAEETGKPGEGKQRQKSIFPGLPPVSFEFCTICMNYPANKKLNKGGMGTGYLGETKPATKRLLKAKGQVTLAALLTGCPALTTPNPTLPTQAQITSFSSNSYMALFLNLFQGQNLRH